MGLDALELVLEIEEQFDVQIPDDEAEKMMTVGQVYEFILAKRGPLRDGVCLTAASFYRLRRALTATRSAQREAIRPAAELAALLGGEDRRRRWAELGESLGLKLPTLEQSRGSLAITAMSIAWLLSATAAIALGAALQWQFGCFVFLPLLALLVAIVERVMSPYATELVPHWATVGGLAREMASLNHRELIESIGQPEALGDRELWLRLQGIICRQLVVSPEDVRPEASFVNDLGAG